MKTNVCHIVNILPISISRIVHIRVITIQLLIIYCTVCDGNDNLTIRSNRVHDYCTDYILKNEWAKHIYCNTVNRSDVVRLSG